MRTKLCLKCHEKKEIDQFHFKNAAKGTRQDNCIICAKEYARLHYEKNKEKRKGQVSDRQTITRAENKKLYGKFLEQSACSLCSEDDVRCLVSSVTSDEIFFKSTGTLEIILETAIVKCLNCAAKFPFVREGQPQEEDSLEHNDL